jgi:hypothetical protein
MQKKTTQTLIHSGVHFWKKKVSGYAYFIILTTRIYVTWILANLSLIKNLTAILKLGHGYIFLLYCVVAVHGYLASLS